ncbi:sensor histidine kinase [Promicromonospora sp. NPDC057488]|uniref:sensor histidine kinase n=1 Tax=Promicromonospora sp. NPDC057488 TaxID=3346147 RepID=UPI00366DA322
MPTTGRVPATDGPTTLHDMIAPARPRRFDALLNRVGLTTPVARDALLAAAVIVMTASLLVALFGFVVDEQGLTIGPVQGVLLAVAACVQALPLVLRRVRPVLCLGLVVACQVVITAVSPDDLSVGGIPQIIAGYTVGTLLPVRRALAVTAAAAPVAALAAGATALVTGNDLLVPVLNHLASGLISYVVSALVGATVATRRDYTELVRLRAAEVVRTQEATTQAAIFAERSRMARELHDVAAHHLSGLVVQAAAVERQIDSDPEAAKKGTAWIRGQGKETLDSLRLIVGVLRERPGSGGPGEDAHDAPPPGLGALDDLVRTARTLGDTVDLERAGRPRPLAPIADAAFYRVAQESLSNARQHAPGAPVHVTVRFEEREVALEVTNERAAGRGTAGGSDRRGMGLIGMGERAHLVGATLSTDTMPDGGWRVRLALPLHHEVTTTAPAVSSAAPAEGGQE